MRLHLDETDSVLDEWQRSWNNAVKSGNFSFFDKYDVITTDFQTNGRGRNGHSWLAPSKTSLLVGVLIKLDGNSTLYESEHILNFAAALAVQKVVANHVEDDVRIKWPNDILICNKDDTSENVCPQKNIKRVAKKIGGVLANLLGENEGVKYVAVGIGVNVSQNADQLTVDAAFPATSFALQSAQVSTEEVLQSLLAELSIVLKMSTQELRAEVKQVLYPLEDIEITEPNSSTYRAKFCGIADNFALLARDEEGVTHEVVAGDVSCCVCT